MNISLGWRFYEYFTRMRSLHLYNEIGIIQQQKNTSELNLSHTHFENVWNRVATKHICFWLFHVFGNGYEHPLHMHFHTREQGRSQMEGEFKPETPFPRK